MIGGRWKIPIVFHLLAGPERFSELARSLTGVRKKCSPSSCVKWNATVL